MTAEQFADAVGAITGEWGVRPQGGGRGGSAGARTARPGPPADTSGRTREWRVASSDLTRALGRPVRDQVTRRAPLQSTTPQALELVNGEMLTRWLARGARRMLGELPAGAAEPATTGPSAGRTAASSAFDVDISTASNGCGWSCRTTDRTRRRSCSRRGRRPNWSARTASAAVVADPGGQRGLRAGPGPIAFRPRPARRPRAEPVASGLRHLRPGLHAIPRRRWGSRIRPATSARRSTRRCGSSSSTPSRRWNGWCRRRRARRCRRRRWCAPRRRRSIACSGTCSGVRHQPPSGSVAEAALARSARPRSRRRRQAWRICCGR